MNLNKKLVFISILILSAGLAQAQNAGEPVEQTKPRGGIFVEPMITYESGTTSTDYPAPFSNSTGSIIGFGLGARLGLHINDSLFAALDARYSQPQFKDSSNNLDSAATSYNYGPVIGVQMPGIGLRLWGTYVLGGQLNPKESNNVDIKFDEPKGLRLGVGFHISSLSLNLEYQDIKYSSATLEKVGPFTNSSASNNINLTNKSYLLSVSFPMPL